MLLKQHGLQGEVRVRGGLITAVIEGRCVTQTEVSDMDRLSFVWFDFRLLRGYASFQTQHNVRNGLSSLHFNYCVNRAKQKS